MTKALETDLCLNTFNRDYKVYPEPNDFMLDLKGRYEVQFAAIGSMELPMSQYTVEADWNTFGFDVGSSLGAEACRTLTVQFINKPAETAVVLPTPWLEVVSEGAGVWRAARPHGLSNEVLVVQGFGATVLQPTDILTPESVVSVVDDTAVLSGVAPPGSYAVLLVQNAGTRTFATPAQLANVLNANFAALRWPLRVDWDQLTARAVLSSTVAVVAHVNSAALVLRSLGFICRDGPTPIGPPRCQDQSGDLRTLVRQACVDLQSTLTSENFPLGPRIKASLDPGHYDPSNFRSSVEALVNPLSVVGIVPASMFVVDVWGTPSTPILVPTTRSFHPRGIALAITALLSAAGLAVILSFTDDRFVFSTPGDPFVITWGGSPPDQDLAQRLGFDPPTPTLLAREAIGAPRNYEDIPTSVLLPMVYNSVSINLERKFVLVPKPRVQKDPLIPVTVTSDGTTLTVPVGAVPLEYLVLVSGIFAVADQINGDVTVLRPLSVVVPPPGVYPGNIVPALNGASINLYFLLPPQAAFSRFAEIFGFPEGASSGGPTGLVASYVWNFDGPPYVLLILGLQHMSALISHRCREDIKNNLISRIPLYPPFKIERAYPMQRVSTGVSYITQLHILLLNPWHQPVQFHGRNWSFQLILGSSQRTAHTECP